MASSNARSPFLEHTAHSSVLAQKEVIEITPVSEGNGKKSRLPQWRHYYVPNGFADSKMSGIGYVLDTQLFFSKGRLSR